MGDLGTSRLSHGLKVEERSLNGHSIKRTTIQVTEGLIIERTVIHENIKSV